CFSKRMNALPGCASARSSSRSPTVYVWLGTWRSVAAESRSSFACVSSRGTAIALLYPDFAGGGSLASFPIPRPGITRDNQFFWDGVAAGRLLIQRCARCHRLQHPPAPMCPGCQGLDMEAIEASGRGTIHSFVVAQHPPIPPFEYPNVVLLVDLEEGTRLVLRLSGHGAASER